MISIIIPAFNAEDTILRTIDSVLVQTYEDIEIVIVDDGSSDNTGLIVESVARIDPRVILIHTENQGAMKARLTGVSVSSGEWIGFIDADDVVESDMYQRLIENANRFGADISHCGYRLCFPDGRVNFFHNTSRKYLFNTNESIKELLKGERIEPGLWNKLYSRKLFSILDKDVELPFDIKINEDLLLNYYLFSSAKATVFEDWCPYHYMVREGSITHKNKSIKMMMDPIRVKSIILKHCDKELIGAATIAYINTCVNVYNSILDSSKPYFDIRQIIRECIRDKYSTELQLGIKRGLAVKLILDFPRAYKIARKIYMHLFQNDPYS